MLAKYEAPLLFYFISNFIGMRIISGHSRGTYCRRGMNAVVDHGDREATDWGVVIGP